ncbi:hypothetical protein C8Q74DRAFT_1212863 [Fomes fomentarius]|nr:hypothetical protein C8Q74DRAFT_1212863 [Fomes fomentarius]
MLRSLFVAFLALLLVVSPIHAVPTKEIAARQIGNLQCNIDRLKIVGALTKMQKTLAAIAGGDDADAAASIQPVQDSISSAQSAIGTIAKSLLTGQQAPDDARDQVKDGLVAAGTALGNITSTDADVSANLEKATTQLSDAASAGEGVVANCK